MADSGEVVSRLQDGMQLALTDIAESAREDPLSLCATTGMARAGRTDGDRTGRVVRADPRQEPGP